MRHPDERLSIFVENLMCQDKLRGDHLTVGQLVDDLHKKGHMFVSLIFAAPFLLPIPLPGLSTVFGAVILLAALQMTLGHDPWLPEKWRHHAVPLQIVEKTLGLLAKLLRRIEFIFQPRLLGLSGGRYANQANGVALIILAILLALPMPPGFNAPPAAAIILLAIGVLEQDGFAIIGGWILCMVNVVLFGGFFVLGYNGLKAFFS